LSDVYFDFIELLSIAKDNIVNQVLHKSIILEFIKDHTQLLFAESTLTHFGVHDLLDGEFLQGIVFAILSVTLKEIDSASFEPCIRPSTNVKVISHDFAAIMLLVIGLLETRDEVCEFCIFPRVFIEVDMKSVLQNVFSEYAVDLL
jgi:hypothetical protein